MGGDRPASPASPASSAQAKRAGSAGSFVNYHEDIMGFASPCSLIYDSTRSLAAAVLAQAVEDATVVALWPVSGIVHETLERDLWLELGAWFLDGEDGAEWFGGGIWQTLVGVVHSRAQAHAVSWKRMKNKQYGAVWGTWTERNAVEAEREACPGGPEAYVPPVRRMPSSDHYTTPSPLSRQFLQRNYGPKISILFCSDALDMEPATILRLTAQRIIQTAIRTTFLRARQVAMAEIAGRRPGDLFGDDWIALPSEEWFSPRAPGIPPFEVFHGTGRAGGGIGRAGGATGEEVEEGIQQDQIPFTLAWCCRHARIDPDVLRGRVAEAMYASVELESEEWREALKGEGSEERGGVTVDVASILPLVFSASNRASMTLDAELDLRGILSGGMRLADMDRRMKEEAIKVEALKAEAATADSEERSFEPESVLLPLPSLEDHAAVRGPAVEAILAMELQRWQRHVVAVDAMAAGA